MKYQDLFLLKNDVKKNPECCDWHFKDQSLTLSTFLQVSAGFNESSQNYEIRTFNHYKKHDQVFISYGQHDSHKLFIEYGFCVPGNSNDVYEFSYSEFIR